MWTLQDAETRCLCGPALLQQRGITAVIRSLPPEAAASGVTRMLPANYHSATTASFATGQRSKVWALESSG